MEQNGSDYFFLILFFFLVLFFCTGPLSWLDPGAYGTLGVGGGFALAAALHFPEKEIWIIWGDGSAGYSIAEFDTVS